MNDEYSIMSPEEALDLDVSGLKQVQRQSGHQYHWTRYLSFTFVLVAIVSLWSLASNKSTTSYHHPDHAKTAELTTTWAHFWWHTSYSSKGKNNTESDDLWDQILPSHGFVAIDREWAGESQWPVSMYLPSDHSKGVYLLEAYHQLHCLRILRKTFWEAVERRPFTYHVSHSDHCFDALRQSVICNADNTPLYTFGDKTAGNGQLHQCRDWSELREYATEHTACYKDIVEDVPLGDHFGFCDDGDDGVIGLS